MNGYRPSLRRQDSISNRWLDVLKSPEPSRPVSPAPITLPSTPPQQSPGHAAAQTVQLLSKFPELSQDDILKLVNRFHAIPSRIPGRITKNAAISALQSTGEATYDHARETLKVVQADATGLLELEDWIEFATRARSDSPSTMIPGKRRGTLLMRSFTTDASHTIDEDERAEFTQYINTVLAGDLDVGSRLPLPTDTMQIFDDCRDGLIICKLIEHAFPGTIASILRDAGRKRYNKSPLHLNVPSQNRPLNKFQIAENNNVAIAAAQAIGCTIVNIGGQDLAEGKEHLIFGLIGQIIRLGLLRKVDLKWHPELFRLCEPGETHDSLRLLSPDHVLLRWFNYHLEAAGSARRITNFHKDLIDGECYHILLHQLKPRLCPLVGFEKMGYEARAESILQNAERVGCRKYITVRSLVSGNPRLNLAFIANLFNVHPGLEPPSPRASFMDSVQTVTASPTIQGGGTRASSPTVVEPVDMHKDHDRIVELQLNSAFMERGTYNLFEDLKGGIIILQALDKITPGAVVWSPVHRTERSSKVERQRAERSKTERPRTEKTKTERARTESPQVESPKVEKPKVEKPKLRTNFVLPISPSAAGSKSAMRDAAIASAAAGQRRALIYTRTGNGLRS